MLLLRLRAFESPSHQVTESPSHHVGTYRIRPYRILYVWTHSMCPYKVQQTCTKSVVRCLLTVDNKKKSSYF